MEDLLKQFPTEKKGHPGLSVYDSNEMTWGDECKPCLIRWLEGLDGLSDAAALGLADPAGERLAALACGAVILTATSQAFRVESHVMLHPGDDLRAA